MTAGGDPVASLRLLKRQLADCRDLLHQALTQLRIARALLPGPEITTRDERTDLGVPQRGERRGSAPVVPHDHGAA